MAERVFKAKPATYFDTKLDRDRATQEILADIRELLFLILHQQRARTNLDAARVGTRLFDFKNERMEEAQ